MCAAILCTPTQLHARQAIQCLAAGKHVQVPLDWENGVAFALSPTQDGFVASLAAGAREEVSRYDFKDVEDESHAPVTEAVAVLLQACERAGEVRPGLEAADVLLLMGFLWSRAASDAGEQQTGRVLDLAISGLQ